MNLYPLQFYPIFKERIWGGTKLKTVLDKNISSDIIGESWELSDVENSISIVSNGAFKGKSLTELIEIYKDDIVGIDVYSKFGNQFPLLFKYLDAREELSIQVHPNDELAKKRHNSFGKTEMWYVLQADPGAKIIVGFKENSSPTEYLYHLNNKSIVSILEEIEVKKGDVFFLETGTIHAIGAGMIIAEIQQTSDITYRIYDFDRVDASGNLRELHTDLAIDAINYQKVDTFKPYLKNKNQSNEIVNCPYFTTNSISLNGEMQIKRDKKSFVVYMCVEGSFQIIIENQNYDYKMGDTILIPAAIATYQLTGTASLLEIYIS